MKFKKIVSAVAVASAFALSAPASASTLIGGDAANFASANSILDIVFVIDTSGSMTDDIVSIGNTAANVITNLSCPTSDCFVRARFMTFTGTYGTFWNESVQSYVNTKVGPGTSTITTTEDNGPAVIDLANHYDWGTDAGTGQTNYHAIVTIGDEGTQNGAPVNQDDYDVAYLANQAALAKGIFLFSWVTDDPSTGVPALFKVMAEGGSGGGYTFSDTGGAYLQGLTDTGVSAQLQDIICTAAGGGTGGNGNGVPEPGTLALMGLGLAGLSMIRRRKYA